MIIHPKTLAAAARLLLDLHFTPVLAELIRASVDLDVPALDLAGAGGAAQAAPPRFRRRGPARLCLPVCDVRFRRRVRRYPVGIEAAHVRWHSQQGPDEIANALALCALHHALFDLGVLGQVRSVDVHRLLAEDTVDQRMLELLAAKAVVFDEYVRRSELRIRARMQ